MAMTGFLVHGNCVADSATAVVLLSNDFPMIQNNVLWSGYSFTLTTPAAGTAGTATYYSYGVLLGAVTQYAPAHKTFYVNRCDPAVSLIGLSPFNAVTAASFWMWAMTMVLGVWLLAHNAGAIMRFIQGRKY